MREGGRGRGAARGQRALHRHGGRLRPALRRRGEVPPRQRHGRRRRQERRHHERRYGGADGVVPDAARARRRGHRARAVLLGLRRRARDCERRARPRRDEDGGRLQAARRRFEEGAHREDEGDTAELAEQPERSGANARESRRDRGLRYRERHLGDIR